MNICGIVSPAAFTQGTIVIFIVAFIVAGDFNARCGQLNDMEDCDYLSEDFKPNFPIENSNSVQLPKRKSQDNVTNKYGKRLIEFCRNQDIAIVNGRIGSGKGEVSCKDASLVDYFLASHSVFPIITDMCVQDFDPLLSDVHCPITLTLLGFQELPVPTHDSLKPKHSLKSTLKTAPVRPKWQVNKAVDFVVGLDQHVVNRLNDHLSDVMNKEQGLCDRSSRKTNSWTKCLLNAYLRVF